jgi:hypothetical protein
MKHIISTSIGILLLLATIAMVFLDMVLSTKDGYTFEMEWWHPIIGITLAAIFIFFEPEDIKDLLKKAIRKGSKKI